MSTTPETVAPVASRPGNVTVRELAATLSQSAPPQSPPPNEDVPAETTPAAVRDPAATPMGTEPVTPAETSPPDSPEPAETTPAEEMPTEETPAVEPTETKSTLPSELADAMALAKSDGKKGVADLLGRVHKLVDQRDTERNARLTAEEKAVKLEADLAEVRAARAETPAAPATNGQNPEVAAVVKQIGNVDYWLNQCDESPDGLKVPDGNGGEIELDAAGVREARKGLERQRQELVAEKVNVQTRVKEAYKADYATAHATAQKVYPEIFKPESPEAKLGAELLKAVPSLKQFADYEVIVGRYINGCKLELARTKTATTGARKVTPAREPALVPTESPGAQPARVNGVNKEVQQLESIYEKSGKTSDLARLNAAKLRATRSKT